MDKVALRKIAARVIFALFFGISAFAPNFAGATVAANATITSTTTVEYDDGFAVRTIEVSTFVTVNLVTCPPILSAPSDQTSSYEGPLSTHVYEYTLKACGNGPDTYDLVSNIVVETNNAGDASSAAGIASLSLGASVLTDGSTGTTLVLPSDGTADGVVNGIALGDVIEIAGEIRTVGAVDEPDNGGEVLVTLTVALSSPPAMGELVAEIAPVDLDLVSGTVATPGTAIVVEASFEATNSAGTTNDSVVSTFGSGDGRLTKYVRNLSNPSANARGAGARNFNVGGSTAEFYIDGVTGGTGDVLEYVLFVENDGDGSMTGSRIVDSLPAVAAQFEFDAYGSGRDVAYAESFGVTDYFTATGDQDEATLVGDTLSVNVGTGTGPGAGDGGEIPPDGEVTAAFRVKLQ